MKSQHFVSSRHAPDAVLIRCTCGWADRVSRRQNAWARATRVCQAINAHLDIVAGAEAAQAIAAACGRPVR